MHTAASTTKTLAKRAQSLKSRMTADERSALAQDMSQALDAPGLTPPERALAEEIIAKLVEDEVVSVRVAISKAVAGSPHLPGEIAKKLAKDISEVAVPVLQLSPILEEMFLEEIIRTGITEKIQAIANRANVSASLSRSIVAADKTGPVVTLLKNPTAQINNQTMITLIRVYGDNNRVEQAVFDRGHLPDDVLDTLRNLAEAHVATFIQRYFNLPSHVVDVEKGRKLDDIAGEDRRDQWWDTKEGVI